MTPIEVSPPRLVYRVMACKQGLVAEVAGSGVHYGSPRPSEPDRIFMRGGGNGLPFAFETIGPGECLGEMARQRWT